MSGLAHSLLMQLLLNILGIIPENLVHYPKALQGFLVTLCELEWLVAIGGSVIIVGQMVGNSIFGWLADRNGRKPSPH